MVATMEPLIKKSAAGPDVPLNTAGPLSLEQLRTHDVSHYSFKAIRRLRVPADGLAQGTYEIFSVAPNTLVRKVVTVVKVAFTASVTLTIGDGTQAAGFLASADIGPQTLNNVANSDTDGEAYAGGKLYTAKDTIDLVVGGAAAAVGELYVEIEYVELERFGRSDIE